MKQSNGLFVAPSERKNSVGAIFEISDKRKAQIK